MKKIILPALLVGGLTLFSFTTPTNGGVNETGKSLQESTTGLKFAQQNNEQIKDLTAKNYDLGKTQLIGSHLKDGIQSEIRGKWIFISKFSLTIFSTTVINDGGGTETTTAASKVTDILDKYAKTSSSQKASSNDVKKASSNEYSLSTNTKFSEADKKTLIDFVKKEYNLSDEQLEKGVVLDMKNY